MNIKVKIALLLSLQLVLAFQLLGQLDTTEIRPSSDYGIIPKKDIGGLKNLQISGFYRFFATYQRQLLPYQLNPIIGDSALPRNIFIGDDSQLPNLLLNVSGRTSDKTSWGFDIMMFQFLNGVIGTSYSGQTPDSLRPSVQNPIRDKRLGSNLGLNLGINLHGEFKTGIGNLSVNVGGIQWYNMSELTMASFRGYNRFLLYERNPWDPIGQKLGSRYQQYFEQGSISQDTRWGNRAFTGLIIQGNGMPYRTSFSLLVGKTELNGGFSSVPNYTYGGKFKKDFGSKNFVSLNTINSNTSTDSLSNAFFGFKMVTLEFRWLIKEYSIKGEIGGGNYFSPTNKSDWGEAIQIKIATPENNQNFQTEVHYYRISRNVVNNNAVYFNTATPEFRVNNIPAGSVGSSALLQPFNSAMLRLGQMTNNRQGVNLNFQVSTGKFKFNGGLGYAEELTPSAADISYGHAVNQLTRSRFWRWNFPAGVGPYGRYSDIYRDTYETVKLSDDSSGVVVHRKFFNMMEGQVKYHTKLLGKDIYLFTLLQANSSSRDFSAITIFNEKAYVRQYISEFEMYYACARSVLVNAYYGFERTLANYLTDINSETFRPRNQIGKGIGCGLDIDFGKNTRLYIRHRWYSFEDKSFALDKYNGRELTVELKAFF